MDCNRDIDFFIKVYAAQPREGTETTAILLFLSSTATWFMQLNPARGRKHKTLDEPNAISLEVYAAQPREGTETHNAPRVENRRVR